MTPKLCPYMEVFKTFGYWTLAEQKAIYKILNKSGGSE